MRSRKAGSCADEAAGSRASGSPHHHRPSRRSGNRPRKATRPAPSLPLGAARRWGRSSGEDSACARRSMPHFAKGRPEITGCDARHGTPLDVEDCPGDEIPRTRKNPGDDLFSRKAALSVSSALESLTSVFGMGTGVASPPESPGFLAWLWFGRTVAIRIGSRGVTRVTAHERDARLKNFDFAECAKDDPDPHALTRGQARKRSSPRPLVRLSLTHYGAYTCRLSNRWSPCGLTRLTRWGISS